MAAPQTSRADHSGGHPVVRVTGVPADLSELAAEFPGYEFATQPTWDGISVIALRRGGCARSGLYAVVTDDLDEMRRTLLEHEAAQPPG
jgi:hypothetical protein